MDTKIEKTSKGMIKDDAYWVVAWMFSDRINYYEKRIKEFRSRGAHSLANETISLIGYIKKYAERAGIDMVDLED